MLADESSRTVSEGNKPDSDTYTIGYGLSTEKQDTLKIGVKYNYEFNDDFKSHSFGIEGSYRF